MTKEEIQIKIASTQELINIEGDQQRKNELMHKLQMLKLKIDIEDTKDKIIRMRDA